MCGPTTHMNHSQSRKLVLGGVHPSSSSLTQPTLEKTVILWILVCHCTHGIVMVVVSSGMVNSFHSAPDAGILKYENYCHPSDCHQDHCHQGYCHLSYFHQSTQDILHSDLRGCCTFLVCFCFFSPCCPSFSRFFCSLSFFPLSFLLLLFLLLIPVMLLTLSLPPISASAQQTPSLTYPFLRAYPHTPVHVVITLAFVTCCFCRWVTAFAGRVTRLSTRSGGISPAAINGFPIPFEDGEVVATPDGEVLLWLEPSHKQAREYREQISIGQGVNPCDNSNCP